METKKRANDTFLEKVKKIIYTILRKEKLLQSEFHFGKVNQVISTKQLSVFIDGDTTAQTVRCNPDVTFNVGDNVLIVFVNNDPKSKIVTQRIVY